MGPDIRPPSVIIVQQDEPLVRLLAWLFEGEGFVVRTATGPLDADDDHAVVILNTNISGDEKNALISEWRRLAPAARFIDIHERRGSPRDQAGPSKADAHFEMPFDSADLLSTARSMQI